MTAERAIALPRLPSEFKVLGLLARGSMCDIFHGLHRTLDVPIAIKVLSRTDEPELASRFRLEARLHARLSAKHGPHIPRCYHSGAMDDGRPYLVMERLNGTTLQEMLRKDSFDPLTVIDVGIQLFQALSVVHSCGAVHRDLGPQNVFLHNDRENVVLRLIDFGLARICDDPTDDSPAPRSVPTDEDAILGTPRVMAPELVQNPNVGPSADLYSGGALLYWMLAGHDPFHEHKTITEVLSAQVNALPQPLARYGVPRDLERVVLRLLEKSPHDRYPDASAVVEALNECGEQIRQGLTVLLRDKSATPNIDDYRNPQARHVFRPGELCGPYVIRKFIDGGGFAEVYAAQPDVASVLNRHVAIKVLKKAFAADPRRREQFVKEMNLLADMRHPNMVRVYEAGEHDGVWWMAMDLIPGMNLRHLMNQNPGKPLDFSTAFHWAYQVASALHEAHRKGIIHADLKPDNVMVTEDAYVLDMGLARLISEVQRKTSRHLTGTILYSAPETLMGLPRDARCDVYSWGLMFFEMLVGHHAFSEGEPPHKLPRAATVAFHHLNTPIPDRKKVLRCTAKAPEQRPNNLGEVCEELERLELEWSGTAYLQKHLEKHLEAQEGGIRRANVRSFCLGAIGAACLTGAIAYRLLAADPPSVAAPPLSPVATAFASSTAPPTTSLAGNNDGRQIPMSPNPNGAR